MSALFRAMVLGGLRNNVLRSLVTLIAVALGVAVSLSIDLANATAVASFSSSADIVSNHINLQILGIGNGFDERVFARIRGIRGISEVVPVAEGSVVIGARPQDPLSGDILRVEGIDIFRPLPGHETQSAHFDPYMLIAERGAIVPASAAARYHLRSGDHFEVLAGSQAVSMRVAGILPTTAALVDSGTIFTDIVTAQEIFGKIGLLDRIDCIVDTGRFTDIVKAITAMLPPGARAIEPRIRTGEIRRMLRSFQSNLAALSYVSLLIGMYLIYNTIAISVLQRRPQIGTLRALGVTRGGIFALFLTEGALFGICGSLAGLLLGAFLAHFALAAVTHTVSSLYVGTQADHVVYRPFWIFKAFFAGTALAVLSAIAPALEAASTPPAVAMRGSIFTNGDTGPNPNVSALGAALLLLASLAACLPAINGVPVFGYAAALLALFGASFLIPVLLIVVVHGMRGFSRRCSPATYLGTIHLGAALHRNSVAVASLMIAVSMMVGIAVLVGSFRQTIVIWVNETILADLFVKPAGMKDASTEGRFSPSTLARIRDIRGVAAADGFRSITIPFRGTLTTLAAADFRTLTLRPKMRFLGNVNISHLAAALPTSNGILASEPFATRFGVRAGDTISLPTPSGQMIFHVAAVYNDYSSDAGVLIMDQGRFARLFHDDTVDSIAIFAKPGIHITSLRTNVLRGLAPLRVTIETSQELRDLVLTIFNRVFSVTDALYVISIFIAVLGVMSTLFALVLERRQEIALLRRLGLSIGNVRSMILTEAALIGVLGGAGGTIMGIVLGLLLIFVIDRQSFGWLIELHMPYGFLLATVGMAIVFSLAAGLYPAEEAARTRTAEALRAE